MSVADQGSGELGSAGPNEPVETEDFALVKGEAQIAMSERRRDSNRLENGLVAHRFPIAEVGDRLLAPNHRGHHSAAAHRRNGFARHDRLSVAQHRDAVRERNDLVELVADENDRFAFRFQSAQHGKERFSLVTGNRCGRFVEKE